MAEWNRLLVEIETTARSPLRPQMVIKAVSDLIADDAVISLDCGANTHFAARNLMLRPGQRLTGTGVMASWRRACRSPLLASSQSGPTIGGDSRRRRICDAHGGDDDRRAAQSADQDHRSQDNSLAEVKFEQIELGNPRLVAISRRLTSSPLPASALTATTASVPRRCGPRSRRRWLSPRPTLVEAIVDPDEKPANPNELRI